MEKLPVEFSFVLSKSDKILYFANKHRYDDRYSVSWKSTRVKNKIDSVVYPISSVEKLVEKGNWIIIDEF